MNTGDALDVVAQQPGFSVVVHEAPRVFEYAVAVGYEQALADVAALLGAEGPRLDALKAQFQEDLRTWAAQLR